jgi:hypothetical protein
VDFLERHGDAGHPAPDRAGDVEEVDMQGRAGPDTGADLPPDGGADLGPVGVVLHPGRIGLGVGQDAAVGGDDGEPAARGLGQRMRILLGERGLSGAAPHVEHADLFGDLGGQPLDVAALGQGRCEEIDSGQGDGHHDHYRHDELGKDARGHRYKPFDLT